MSPEVIEGSKPEKPSDIFSLAFVCWELISGAVPFGDLESGVAIAVAVRDGKRPPLPSYSKEEAAAVNVVRLIRDMWSQEPTVRPEACSVYDLITGAAGLLDAGEAARTHTHTSIQAMDGLKQAIDKNTEEALAAAIDNAQSVPSFNPPELQKAKDKLAEFENAAKALEQAMQGNDPSVLDGAIARAARLPSFRPKELRTAKELLARLQAEKA